VKYNSNLPLVSIILPVYNGEKYLEQSIESCLNQTYKNIELIIVNDCSTDATLTIAKEYANKDSRIKIINNETNQKLPNSLNIGHECANGNLITWTSDDNLYLPNAIEVMVHQLEAENVDFVYANLVKIDSNGKETQEFKLEEPEELLWRNVVGACFLYTKKLFISNESYDNKLFLVEDYDFWLRAFMKFDFYHINKTLYKYRVHESSLTSQLSEKNSVKNILYEQNKIKMYSYVFTQYSFPNEFQKIILEFQKEKTINIELLIANLRTFKKFYKKLSFGRYDRYLSSLKDKIIRSIKVSSGFQQYYSFIILILNFGSYMSIIDFKNSLKYLVKSFFK
jgi:glycosyltransferase involved in cell wall biosynthesis